jgi:hypothetical protein
MSFDSTERRALSWTYINRSLRKPRLRLQSGDARAQGRGLGARSVRTLGFIAARPRGTIAAAGIVKSAWNALFLFALLLGAARGAEYYGVDPGGSRYAELAQINTAMSTGWSLPGPIALAISPGATRLCCATRNSR